MSTADVIEPDPTTYDAWDETRLVKDKILMGSAAVHYREDLIKTHAVPVEDGVPSDMTMCGIPVPGNLRGPFEAALLVIRCGKCAETIGVAHVGR
jgi:hypothetical protein